MSVSGTTVFGVSTDTFIVLDSLGDLLETLVICPVNIAKALNFITNSKTRCSCRTSVRDAVNFREGS